MLQRVCVIVCIQSVLLKPLEECDPQPVHHNTNMNATFAPPETTLKHICLPYRVLFEPFVSLYFNTLNTQIQPPQHIHFVLPLVLRLYF